MFELVCVTTSGWISDNQKEEVICSGKILVADIMSLKTDDILTVNLPLRYSDTGLKNASKSLSKNETEVPHPKLELRIKNLSSIKSYFAPQYGDYIEGIKMTESDPFSKQLLKLSIARLMRAATYLSIQAQDVEGIFNFKYPIFSYICFIVSFF